MGEDIMSKKETSKRQKENRKKLKELEKQANEESYEMSRLIKIFVGVVGVLLLVYLIFAFFHGDDTLQDRGPESLAQGSQPQGARRCLFLCTRLEQGGKDSRFLLHLQQIG